MAVKTLIPATAFPAAAFLAAGAVLALTHAANAAQDRAESRKIEFPAAADGRHVLAVDPHTHSVFSDGHVWPSVRVWEAERDDLDAMMVTEHLEYQPYKDDIPHPDRNRAFEVATEWMERMDANTLVINGAEITRSLPPGHVNAVFITDANALLVDDAREAIETAKGQGAFTFWNHAWWPVDFPDGRPKVTAMHRALIDDGLLDGIEVANGSFTSDDAFQIALDNDLGIIGVSDVHGLIDYSYDFDNGGHRTVTLALAGERTVEGIKAAFENKETVALYNHTLLGREPQVRAIVEGALSLETKDYIFDGSKILNITISNGASSPFTLRNIGDAVFNSAANVFTVPANGSVDMTVNGVEAIDAFALRLQVVNAFIAPRTNLTMILKDQSDAAETHFQPTHFFDL